MALSDSEKKKAHRNRSGSVAESISPSDNKDNFSWFLYNTEIATIL